MKIQIILGSTRPNRVGERVAKWVTAAAKNQPGFQVELVDLADYDLPHFDEPISPKYNPDRQPHPAVKRLLAKVGEAEGYVIVTPEYNHSIPGVLKDALDFMDWQLDKKAVAIVGYGSVGGARSAEHLRHIVNFLGAAVVPATVALMRPTDAIDEHGTFTGDTTSPYGPTAALAGLLKDLAWWTGTLTTGRAQK
jgi:NAD(P)H-dependent FMN reductase